MLAVATILGFVAFLWLPQEALTMLPLLRRLPQHNMVAREAVLEQVGTLSGMHQAGDIGNLVLVSTVALIALELCFVLFDLINLAYTTGQTHWQKNRRTRGNHMLPRQRTEFPAGTLGSAAQQQYTWLSHVAAESAQAGKADREIQQWLTAAGLDADAAALMVTSLTAGRLSARKQALRQVVLSGAIVSVLGVFLTLGAWWGAAHASMLVLTGSVSLVAGVRLLRGLIQYRLQGRMGSERARRGRWVRGVLQSHPQALRWGLVGIALLGASYAGWGVYAAKTQAQRRAVTMLAPGPKTTHATTMPTPIWPWLGQAPLVVPDTAEQKNTPSTPAAAEDASRVAQVDTPETNQGASFVPKPPNQGMAAHASTPPGLSATPVPRPDGVVRAQSVNLRSGPGEGYPVLRQLASNDALAIIGQVERPNWLKVRGPDGQEGWVSGDTRLVQLNRAKSTIPVVSFRPLTGIVEQRSELTGMGELQIANAAGKDGLVMLGGHGQRLASVYVRAGEIYTLRGIPDGTYTIVTSQGNRWNGNSFIGTVNPKHVEAIVTFETTAQEYTVWDISLVDGSIN